MDLGIKTPHTPSVPNISFETCCSLIKERNLQLNAQRGNEICASYLKSAWLKHGLYVQMFAKDASRMFLIHENCTVVNKQLCLIHGGLVFSKIWSDVAITALHGLCCATMKHDTQPPEQPHIFPFELLLANIKLEYQGDYSKLWL